MNGACSSDDFLHAIETLLALLRIGGLRLRAHQLVNLGFPCGFRRFLLRIPGMIFRRTHPDVHLAVGIDVHIAEPEDGGLVVEFLRNALDERWEIERDHDLL